MNYELNCDFGQNWIFLPHKWVKGRLILMNYSPDINKRAKKAKAEGRQQQKEKTSYLKTAVIQLTFVKSSDVS